MSCMQSTLNQQLSPQKRHTSSRRRRRRRPDSDIAACEQSRSPRHATYMVARYMVCWWCVKAVSALLAITTMAVPHTSSSSTRAAPQLLLDAQSIGNTRPANADEARCTSRPPQLQPCVLLPTAHPRGLRAMNDPPMRIAWATLPLFSVHLARLPIHAKMLFTCYSGGLRWRYGVCM